MNAEYKRILFETKIIYIHTHIMKRQLEYTYLVYFENCLLIPETLKNFVTNKINGREHRNTESAVNLFFYIINYSLVVFN